MITPMDIHNKTFSKKLRGYADDEVNSFLEEVASDYERIYREHREMEEQMDSLKSRLAHYGSNHVFHPGNGSGNC